MSAIAVVAGLSLHDVGLSRDALPAGVRIGGLAVLVVGVVVAVGITVIGSDSPLLRDHIGQSTGDAPPRPSSKSRRATVLLEEIRGPEACSERCSIAS